MNDLNNFDNKSSDVAQLSRLHWSSILFDAIAQIRGLIVPAVLLLLGAARGESIWLMIGAVAIVPTLIVSIIRFVTLTFQINNGQLVVKHGLIFRNVRSVPVDRIQNIDFVQNPLHRLLGVAEVRVETAAGSEPEATLRVLKLDQVEQLRAAIFESRKQPLVSATADASDFELRSTQTDAVDSTDGVADRIDERPVVTLLTIPTLWLFYAGLSSNRGVLLVGVMLGSLYEAKMFQRINFERLSQLFPKNFGILATITVIALGIVVVMLALRALGIAWYLLRFHGYCLSRKGDDLRISCGMFTKVQATVPRRRIQFISVQRTWIMRLLGLSSVRIETASTGGNHDDATKSVSSRWFIPVVSNEQLPGLLSQIRPGLVWDENKFDYQPLSARASKRMCRLAYLFAFVLSAAGLAFWRPWGFLFGVLALPLLLLMIRQSVRATRYARTSEGVVFRSGVFTVKTSMTFFEKIQSLQLDQSPFDRRWRMAKLSIDTAAAGPAEHQIHIPLLDEAIALREQQTIKQLAALHQPVFG